MTPAARYAAAIEILDKVLQGTPAEKALTSWARGSRFAGSKDRAAIRDHVFDVLRAKRSLAGLGGGGSGRKLIIGLLKHHNIALESVFGAGPYGPLGLTKAEQAAADQGQTLSEAASVDLPDWLLPVWSESLGADAIPAAKTLQSRAPVWLRANTRKADLEQAAALLAEDGVTVVPSPDVRTALRVIDNPRKVQTSQAYQNGIVELQDASSQQAMLELPVPNGARVLDFCAGGGGKSLAMADLYDAEFFAHDVAMQRMVDLPRRAERAGVVIKTYDLAAVKATAPFDVVLCDAPCSGSGTWRRTPEAKWALTPEKLSEYNNMQADVLASGAALVARNGCLAYATCSVLRAENDDIVDAFLADHPGWSQQHQLRRTPTDAGDGFCMVVLQKL